MRCRGVPPRQVANDGPVAVAFGADIPDLLDTVDWSKTVFVAHNGNEFDHLISAWVYGVNPLRWMDTLVMARRV